MRESEQQLLKFISDYIQKNGFAPTYTEMMEGTDVKSKRSIFVRLDKLVEAGRIARVEGKSRAIRVLDSSPVGLHSS